MGIFRGFHGFSTNCKKIVVKILATWWVWSKVDGVHMHIYIQTLNTVFCGLWRTTYRVGLHVCVLLDFPVSKDSFASEVGVLPSSNFKFGAICDNLTVKYLLKFNL